MNSTEETDALLRSFYETEFVRAAQALSARGARVLVTGFDEGCQSYFVERTRTTLGRSDFELSPEDPRAVEQALRRLWSGPESDVLAELLPKILALSPHCAETEVDRDVSPHVYVMF
ncbi:MAG TPA: hypothetical protein VF297_03245 [Pyrinomonadaceae bacterium]